MSTFTPEVWDDTLLKQSCRLSNSSRGSRRPSTNASSSTAPASTSLSLQHQQAQPNSSHAPSNPVSLDRTSARNSSASRPSSPGPERRQSSSSARKQKQQQQHSANGVIAYSMSTMFSDPTSIDEMDLDEEQIQALLNKQTLRWTIFHIPPEDDVVKPQQPVGPLKVHTGRFFAQDSDESDSDAGDHVVPNDHDHAKDEVPRRPSSSKRQSPLVPSLSRKREENVSPDSTGQPSSNAIAEEGTTKEVKRVGSSHSLFRDFFVRHKEAKGDLGGSNSSPNVMINQPENKAGTTGIFNGLSLKSNAKSRDASLERNPPSSSTSPTSVTFATSGSGSPLGTSSNGVPMERKLSSKGSLQDEYGEKRQALGRGANAVVKLCCPANGQPGERYAIKEFRKRRRDESPKEYLKKVVSEFCISTTLKHENVIKTVDLIQDESKNWCEVMEYMEGGDLYARIHAGLLTDHAEINCYFKQIVNGVRYLHEEMGVAHRDLKPENLLLDKEKKARKMKGVCGSSPYIAPEEFGDGPDSETIEYEPEPVDVWAIGIILYVMYYNAIPWKMAVRSDGRYKYYLEHKNSSFWPIDRLSPGPRRLLYRMLDPNPETRIKISEMVEDDWFRSIEHCTHAAGAPQVRHKHGPTSASTNSNNMSINHHNAVASSAMNGNNGVLGH
ncbi:hypothetical protein SeMB42_g00023 [Synchytrium endobioticum]|uniref:non-specific serine/threonine protein kinase n=1 Tax=Synchytrium endobioticum TaxID=286115 RepID=A0A507DC39_9FUNG|nr:hypothetical protein SeLEV6574_g02053 [Synchytrium endobioticum]TPX55002.1 hypothetical protein SeMB42_g00023 [Synchytrium endobioticum]